MEGEPGSLMYVDSTDNGFEKDFPKQKYLSLSLYVDEQEWGLMVQRLSQTTAPINRAILYAEIELFQHEVENSLAEPWHRKDYGLLQKDPKSDFCTTSARADHLRVEFKPVSAVVAQTPEASKHREEAVEQPPVGRSLMEGRDADLASIAISLRKLRWQVPVAALVITVAVLLT